MASRPVPTLAMHFTHVDHLASIVADGLIADGAVGQRLQQEAGSRGVKELRRSAVVPLPPGGVVSDYVPFYFAPKSPMMFAILRGQVPEYGTDVSSLVYLVSTVERLSELCPGVLFTRRNAALRNAEFIDSLDALDGHVDWQIMSDQYWRNTDDDGDRRSRRMAECLVHGHVPWDAFIGVAVRDEDRRRTVEALFATLGVSTPVRARPAWYY